MADEQEYRFEPDELAEGFDRPGYTVELDRKRAIALGVIAARRGDTVVVAGKGHETYQIIGGKTIPFDDRVEASRVLEKVSVRE